MFIRLPTTSMTWQHVIGYTFGLVIVRAILKVSFGHFYSTQIGYSFALIISFGVILLIGAAVHKKDRSFLFPKESVEFKDVMRGNGLVFFLCFLCLTLVEIEDVLRKTLNGILIPWNIITTRRLLSSLFVAPFVEEFFYRGFLLTGLLRSYGKVVSVAIVTAIFLLFHLSWADPYAHSLYLSEAFSFIAFSICVCLVMVRYRNIWMCVLMHFIWNLSCYVIPAVISASRLPVNSPVVFVVFATLVVVGCSMFIDTFSPNGKHSW